jgi:hypothetical protein
MSQTLALGPRVGRAAAWRSGHGVESADATWCGGAPRQTLTAATAAKSRGGRMSTTAAGRLCSPQGREYVRGKAYVQYTATQGPDQHRLGTTRGIRIVSRSTVGLA